MTNRQCGSCTECCKGWIVGNIKGHPLVPGSPCRYLHTDRIIQNDGCAIYPDRPNGCRAFRCFWVDDENKLLPEWMQPDLSKIIIEEKDWMYQFPSGKLEERKYWKITECGEEINSEVLNHLVQLSLDKAICMSYYINGKMNIIGPPEFGVAICNGRYTP